MSSDLANDDRTASPAPTYPLLPLPAPPYGELESDLTTAPGPENLHPSPTADDLANQRDHLQALVESIEERVQCAIAKSSSIHFLHYRAERILIDIARWTTLMGRLGGAIEPLEEVLAVLEEARTAANRSKTEARKESALALRDFRRVEKALAIESMAS